MSSSDKNEVSAPPESAGGKGTVQMSEEERKAFQQFNATLSRMVGDVVRMMSMHSAYCHMFMSDIQWLVVPPLLAHQFKMMVTHNEEVLGCVIWAEVTDRVRDRIKKGSWALQPNEWRGGPNAIVMLVLAPPGSNLEAGFVQEVKKQHFAQRRLELVSWARGNKAELVEVEAAARQEKPEESDDASKS
ncbi:MAG: toxin-activating lysine-acyltransferase [Betaproteobacteria bacterium]|nr:toxin-activating lysine-acyltransferase [Betaproteobacteria bacterium]